MRPYAPTARARAATVALAAALLSACAEESTISVGTDGDGDAGFGEDTRDGVEGIGDSGVGGGDGGRSEDTTDAGGGGETGGGVDAGSDGATGTAICGNGRVEPPEVCDDGNNFPGDGCSPTCLSDESCGNTIVDATESCDDGNLVAGDGCSATCQLEVGCGNGRLERGEQCDDGNVFSGDGCSATCAFEVYVPVDGDGDGISDFDEGNGLVDTDGDGTPDSLDDDSDGDGIPDAVEAGDGELGTPPVDTDGDGIPDFRDTDSDDDGIPDSVEGAVDSDGDGIPDFRDTDSDQDYLPDSVEGVVDSDGDGIPDYLDLDSDNDTILDEHELFADSDGDGIPNRLDLDSDNDGLADIVEAGDADPGTYPIDTDGDGRPDYIDTDSDGDGLGDASETGCAAGSSNHLLEDTDGDGFSDLAEFLVGSDRCAATSPTEFATFTDFFFVLPNDGTTESAPLEFSSNIVQGDVAINMDTTGSMGEEISNLRSSLSSSIVPGIQAQIANVAFSVSTFDDFPCGGYGASGDQPFFLRQRATTNIGAAQAAVNSMPLRNGGDYFESGYEALFQIASGAGINFCGAAVPAFNPGLNLVPGVADGTIGGVGFRAGSFPVVIHITDAPSHDAAVGGPSANRARMISALQAIQARVIGVASGSDPRGQLESIARDTGATVRPCAWDEARPGGCGAGQCCTGSGGAGRAPDGSGLCPLVFDISSNGSGLNNAIVTAVRALVNTTTLTVTTTVRRDEAEFGATGIDTRCFIQGIRPNRAVTAGSCTTTPTISDIDPVDGVPDAFTNVTPGTALFFDVNAENAGCVEQTEMPQAFTAYIDVVGNRLTVLDTQTVTIIVPAGTSNPVTVP